MAITIFPCGATVACVPCSSFGPCTDPSAFVYDGRAYEGRFAIEPSCTPDSFAENYIVDVGPSAGVVYESIRPCIKWTPGQEYDITLSVYFTSDDFGFSADLRIYQNLGESVIRKSITHSAWIPTFSAAPCTEPSVSGLATVVSAWDNTYSVPIRARAEIMYDAASAFDTCVLYACSGFDISSLTKELRFDLFVEADV